MESNYGIRFMIYLVGKGIETGSFNIPCINFKIKKSDKNEKFLNLRNSNIFWYFMYETFYKVESGKNEIF